MYFTIEFAAQPAGRGDRARTSHRCPPPCEAQLSPPRATPALLLQALFAWVITACVLIGVLAPHRANAADAVMTPGDAVVTGFSGFRPSGAAIIPGGNLLDGFIINLDGASAQIQALNLFGAPPQGQLVSPGLRKQILARDVGQVFPIALIDSATTGTPPAILLGATSMFGLHIVKPDANGDGLPERIKTGTPGALWMPGMFATDKGGSPGAIWRVDGESGTVTLFATLPDNSGPGIGDIAYDRKSHAIYVSDLDTGLIHRLDAHGQLIDTFDHGVNGRPAKGLAPVSDDGRKADITNAAFDIEKPGTWGYTQVERRVQGMAVHQGRLYYTADHKVWSIGLNGDGSFAGDARWELNVDATTPQTQLTDMLFDAGGRMYIAERGAQRGSYDYAAFAEADKADVKRYRLEEPDDPATESRWITDPETYAVGLPAEHRHSNGGITLGFAYDETGMTKIGACGQFLWTTGERLRAGEFAQSDGGEGDPAANADVHGLQGNPVDTVRPANVPPMTSYFTDYDNFFGDPERAGHLGDVEIWQPCEGSTTLGELPPWWMPPSTEVPPDYPPEFLPPEYPYETNLELTKRAIPNSCWAWGNDWICRYAIAIRNTGPDDYFGDIQFRDWFPANPPGLATLFQPQPPWSCWQPGGTPAETRCWRPNVFLPSGHALFINVWAKVPKNPRRCRLTNIAEIEWAPGGTQWNTDPSDDLDAATAIIPDPACKPDHPKRTNLELKKSAMGCWIVGISVDCGFQITVENVGANDFFGPITILDQMPAGVLFQGLPNFKWTCAPAAGPGTTFKCTTKNPASVFLQPTDKVHLWVHGRLPIAKAKDYGCTLPNLAKIVDPLGDPQNANPADDSANATAQMPPQLCQDLKTNLRLTKTASPQTCQLTGGAFFCKYMIRVINEGPGIYNGDLHVKDTFPAGTDLLLGPGPWSCPPPAGNTRVCKLNGVVMAKNTARSFPVWLKVPQAVAAQHECRIRNMAKITQAPGGTAKNTNPADDEADAWSTIPANLCNGPDNTNLKISKQGPELCQRTSLGFKCDWTIAVTNTGPAPFNGPVVVNEALPGEPANAAWNAPWTCVGNGGGGAACSHPNVALPQGGTLTLNLTTLFPLSVINANQCKLTNLVEIAQPAGGTPKNTDATDDTAQATASVDPAICQPPSAPPQCPPGYRYGDGECVPKTQPPGPVIIPPSLPPSRPPPPPTVEECPAGMSDVSSTRAHHLRSQGWRVLRFHGQWCVSPPRESSCPAGYEQVPQSRIDMLRRKGWTITQAGRATWCGRPGRQCPRGTHLEEGRCVPNAPVCDAACQCRKSGGRWNGRTCVRGTTCWDGSSAPSMRQCPPRTHRCPDGSRLPIGRKCPPRLHTCWNGRKVVNPSLCPPRRIPCGHGYTGFKPNCKKIVRPCPRGTVGPGQPNCRKIIVRKPCPRGTVGTFQPNCRPIRRPPPSGPIMRQAPRSNLR